MLDRGIVFIDLAIAQIAGLGVIGADALGRPEGGIAVQAAAVSAALLGAWLLTWTERRAPQQQEALIGVMFILAACASIPMLAGNPNGGEHLKDLLVGQILWVSTAQIGWLTAVTASVQFIGVYLVFASLIIRALGTRARAGRRRLAVG